VTINLQPKLVDEIARDHDFDVARLGAALVRAVEAHHDEQTVVDLRDNAAAQIGSTQPVLIAVRRALDRWEGLSKEAKQEVAHFVDPSDKTDPIGPKLSFVFDLLEEYSEHYRRLRGNPGRSRTREEANSLDPLREFSAVLMDFWDQEKGVPFGHVLVRQTDVTGIDPRDDQTAPRDAKSAGILFLYEAGAVLQPINYSISNFETVVRQIKKNLRNV